MKKILIGAVVIVLQGCAHNASQPLDVTCIGSTELPSDLSGQFDEATNDALLAKALGKPLEGKLCQGQVYKTKTKVTVYRAWNSTNPNSKLGQWWAFDFPSGLTAKYRENNEICYQWSPLDKLVKCTLKAGTEVVVGNGQSAKCSEYLTYPTSATQQVYIPNAADVMQSCQEYDSVMGWK